MHILCESKVNGASTVTALKDGRTGEYVVTYGERREVYVDEFIALDRYMHFFEEAIAHSMAFN